MASFLLGMLNKKLYGMIFTDDEKLMVDVYDAQTEVQLFQLTVDEEYKTTKDFVADIPKIFPKKAFSAINLQLLYYECSEYPNNVEFCKAVKKQFDAVGIPYHFTSTSFHYSAFLLAAKITPKPNQSILCVFMASQQHFCLTELSFTDKGYRITHSETVYDPYNDKNIQEKIIDRKTSIILVVTISPFDGLLIRKLQQKRFDSCLLKVEYANVMENFTDKGSIELLKWIYDKKYIKYAILPKCSRKYMVMRDGNDAIITAKADTELPFKESCIVAKSDAKYTLVVEDKKTKKQTIIEEICLPNNCHRYFITLIVDTENFPSIKNEAQLIKEIMGIPSTLNESMKSNVPVIAFFDNSSVICVQKEESGYEFLESWNGAFGEELFVSFDEEKPKYNQNAVTSLKSKPASVVFDILKLLSLPPDSDKIRIDKTWKFKITKDDKNPVLIEILNFDGTQKLASPAFLMALMIKEHRRIIRNETGEKPEELAFSIHDNYKTEKFDSEEMKRIKNGIQEACKLLKIKCSFV